ncbi:hypothetical protein LAZ67_23001864 [Cordylochernes scorpioides]|uniref:Uncharacterized protein n=1 Tax=Cordylochernes scorpioides TaxID=51811 RepID=A0ABY6LU12_9ARAC|nr:hypothetical protein LAZ67_23001864 [Cordylochernes scorpioides]
MAKRTKKVGVVGKYGTRRIRPLIIEALSVFGRPPDLRAWIFGSGLEDDDLAILASAKSIIYRYFYSRALIIRIPIIRNIGYPKANPKLKPPKPKSLKRLQDLAAKKRTSALKQKKILGFFRELCNISISKTMTAALQKIDMDPEQYLYTPKIENIAVIDN